MNAPPRPPGPPGSPQRPVDPFAALDGQRTFILPTPGARAGVAAAAGGPPVAQVADDIDAPEVGLNGLLAIANPVLAIAPQLRATVAVADVAALKESLVQAVRSFESRARAAGFANERVIATRYVLCTLLDECAGSTPWGGSGVWGRYSLLAMFHNENIGGEKVFALLSRLAEKPDENRDLLEVIYVAITLGFEGRYRALEGGAAQLDSVRSRLAGMLRQLQGDYPKPLASHWQVPAARRNRFASWTPVWVSLALVAGLLTTVYFVLTMALNRQSDIVFSAIQALRLPAPNVVLKAPPAPVVPRLAGLLADDIRAGSVAVQDEASRSTVVLRGDGLFDSGSAAVRPGREPLLKRIATALGQLEGDVLVTGHTDDQPIRSLRFPSNFHLSSERAQTVRQLLVAQGVAASRINSEGRADSQPLVPNDSPANRALNRRVEIVLDAGARVRP